MKNLGSYFEFLLTRPVRGATNLNDLPPEEQNISTHTPLARRDDYFTSALPSPQNFYSHASCEARPYHGYQSFAPGDFYSHASCEARPRSCSSAVMVRQFLLTRLLRGATPLLFISCHGPPISTHTPLARRDLDSLSKKSVWYNFYSHASCEARQSPSWSDIVANNFYSHASCEARPALPTDTTTALNISTHTPLARRDITINISERTLSNFYSHASCEARP